VEQSAGEAPDVAHAQHRAGHGHGQHGHGLDEALALEFLLYNKIGNDHGKEGRNRGRDQGQHEGILEGLQALILGEHLTEPLEGQGRELIAPGGEQSTDGHAQVHEHHKKRRQGAENRQRNGHAPVGDEHSGPGGLAGQGRSGLGLQIVFLHGEHQQRDTQQHHGHSRSALFVVSAGDLQINGGGQGIIGAADDHGVGKIGNGLDERHQEGVAQARQHQRQGHGGEYLPTGSAHIPGRFFQGGVDVFQQALEHHVAHREEGQRLHNGDAPEAVHAVVIDLQQKPGNEARLTEQHDHGQGQHEGRGHHGQHGHHPEQPAGEFSQLYIHFHIGKQQPQQSRQDAHQEADFQCVPDGRPEGGHGQDTPEGIQREAFLPIEAVHQQNGQGVKNKQCQKCDQNHDGRDHNGVGHQLFPIQRRTLPHSVCSFPWEPKRRMADCAILHRIPWVIRS